MRDTMDTINTTLKWAREVAEMCTNTLYEVRIDDQVKNITNLVNAQKTAEAEEEVIELAQFLHYAEESYGE